MKGVDVVTAGRSMAEIGAYHVERLARAGQLSYSAFEDAILKGLNEKAGSLVKQHLPQLYKNLTEVPAKKVSRQAHQMSLTK